VPLVLTEPANACRQPPATCTGNNTATQQCKLKQPPQHSTVDALHLLLLLLLLLMLLMQLHT
jgi:hypothetical protein